MTLLWGIKHHWRQFFHSFALILEEYVAQPSTSEEQCMISDILAHLDFKFVQIVLGVFYHVNQHGYLQAYVHAGMLFIWVTYKSM